MTKKEGVQILKILFSFSALTKLLIFCLVQILAAACLEDPLSDIKEKSLTRESASFEWSHWAELSREEAIKEASLSDPGIAISSVYENNDPKVESIQAILDKFHASLGRSSIPRPRVLLVAGQEKRAYSFGKRVCLPVLINWDESKPKAEALNTSANGTKVVEASFFDLCEDQLELSESGKISLIEETLAFDPSCLAFESGIFVKLTATISKQCVDDYIPLHYDSKLDAYGSAGGIVTHLAANWIVVYEGMLEKTSEQLKATLAHELAHYYKAHQLVGQGYDFFYQIGQPKASKPLDSELFELASQVKQIKPADFYSSGRSVLKQAHLNKLGYYTAEQEADELALSYLSAIGENPKSMIDSLFDSLKSNSSEDNSSRSLPAGVVLGYQNCLNAYNAGFPEVVGVGYYYVPHHSTCFRIYNLFDQLN